MTHYSKLMPSAQREAVTQAEHAGVGPQALAMVMLLDKQPINYASAVWSCSKNALNYRSAADMYWGSAQRAAIAYCLANDIPLDTPTSAGAIAPHPTPAE